MGIEGSPMTVSEWFEMFVKLYKENKVKGTTLHRIHQTYALCKKDPLGMISLRNVKVVHVQNLINKLQEEGIPYEIIQAFVGHSTTKTTMGYDHYKPELDLSGLSRIQFLDVV